MSKPNEQERAAEALEKAYLALRDAINHTDVQLCTGTLEQDVLTNTLNLLRSVASEVSRRAVHSRL